MNNLSDNKLNNYDDEINIQEILSLLWSKKFFIGSITILFTSIFILIALMLPNIYKSQAIMLPVQDDGGMSGMLSQYSGMAGLAGISLPSESSTKSKEAIARIQSFNFFSNYFLPNIALEDLVAVKNWNPVDDKLIYDKKIYNSELGKWVRKVEFPRSNVPSSQEAYKTYREIMSISEDEKTSFVSLSIKHYSPFIAQHWVELIIEKIDLSMRDQDRNEATKSINFLNNRSPTVNYEEIKKSLSSLQQEQMKRLMMIEANENYIFKVLDSPLAPEMKSEPKRLSIVIIGTILGILLSTLFTIVYNHSSNQLFKKPQL